MRTATIIGLLAAMLIIAGCSGTANEQETPQEQVTKTSTLSEPSLVFSVDGETYTFKPALAAANTPVAEYLTVMTNNAGIQLRMLPNEVGTYHAGEGPNSYRRVDVWFTFMKKQYYANDEVGKATIRLEKVGTMLEGSDYDGVVQGTFSGTFVAGDGSSITIKDGQFMTGRQ